MTPQEKMSALWQRIPRRLFGGRMRTTTVVMCLLWVGLAMLNGQLNEPPKADSNQPAQTSSQRDDRQYQPPAVDPSTETSTSTTPSETATSSNPPSSTETSRPSGQTTTTTAPGAGRETTTTERTTDRQPTTTTEQVQQSERPTETTSGTESTTNPSPGG